MRDEGKTKKQLIGELAELRTRIAALEAPKVESKLDRGEVGAAEERYRSLVELSPDPVVVLQDDHYQFASPAFTKVFGYTQEEVNDGLSFFELVQEHDREAVRRQYEDRLNGNQVPQTYRIDLIAKDGKVIPCETSAALIEHKGRPADLVLIRDITERKQAEEALRKAHDELELKVKERTSELLEANEQLKGEITNRKRVENRLTESEVYMKSVLKAAPIGIGLVKNRVLEWLSDRMSEMLGYSEGELVGQSAKVAYESEEEFERVGKVKYAKIQKQGTGTVETRLKCKDGSILDVLLCSSAIDPADLSKGAIFTALDVTERMQAEQELRESEQRYRSLFKNNHSVMLLVDSESAEIVDANPAACFFYGWPQEELTSMKITDINMLSNEQVFQEIERAKSEERNHFYFRHRLANEEIRDVEVYSGPIRLHGKEFLYSIIHDISERKRMEEELRESERYFRSLLFNMHEDILVIDRDHRITDVNNTLLVTVGRKYEEVVGRHCYEVSHGYKEPCHRKGEDCMLREVFETGEPRSCRHQHIRVNGSKVWVDILLSPLRDESGNVTHVIEAIRDITYLIEMEKELRESEENFRALAENANDGILIAAGEEGVNVYANKRAEEITGYSVAEFMEIGLHELVAPGEVEKVAGKYKRRLKGENVSGQYETALVRKSGEIFPVELSSARTVWEGQPASIVIIRDITKRKRAEGALRKRETELKAQSKHLEEVNAALKVLLKRREEDKIELGENVLANVKELVLPYLEKLKKNQSDPHQMTLVGIVESNLRDIVSPFATKLSSRYLNLTPTEIQVASLIKDGKTNKEIAALLHLSVNTIRSHRHNLRSKLGLKNKKMNLRSYLRSLSNE